MKHFGDAAFGVCPPVFWSSLVHAYCGLSPLVCLQGSVLTRPCLVGFTSACPCLYRSISIHLSYGIVLISAVVYLHLYGMSAGVCSYLPMSSGVYLCLSVSTSVYLYSPVVLGLALSGLLVMTLLVCVGFCSRRAVFHQGCPCNTVVSNHVLIRCSYVYYNQN